MTAVYAEYAYRRATKTQREEYHVTAAPSALGKLQELRGRLAATAQMRREERRRHTLLQLANAERGLHLLDCPEYRQYRTEANQVALRINELGVRNTERGNLVRAFRNFMEAIDRDPDLDMAHNNIGLLYLEIGDHERAERHFTAAITAAAITETGKADAALSNRALMWIEKEDYERAYEDLEGALAIDPAEPMHYNNMGVLFLEGECPEAAMQYFNVSIELDPENPMHHHNRGMALKQMGKDAQATQAFLRASELADQELEKGMTHSIA